MKNSLPAMCVNCRRVRNVAHGLRIPSYMSFEVDMIKRALPDYQIDGKQ